MSAAPGAPSELLSGPDLGGGYLHQLSIDRLGEATTFTHHAQDGGDDAGGPPIGPLGPFGFVHPPSPCMFGGPRCWHRRYLLPFAATPKVRFAYQRFRFVLEAMLRQANGTAPVPFEAALRELLQKVAAPLDQERIEWYVAGSGAVWLAGGGGAPADIDLGTTRQGVDRLGELLAQYLIEPVAPTDRPDGRLVYGARAFVGTPKIGARTEWAVPLDPGETAVWAEFSPTPGVTRTTRLPLPGSGEVPVSRPEYALIRGAERRRASSEEAAAVAVRKLGVDRDLLDALLARSTLSVPERLRVRSLVLP